MTTWTGTPATITAGQTSGVSTAFNNHRDALKALSEAWTAYAPTLTNATLGNGSLNGSAYSQVDKHIWYRIVLTFGSTTAVTGVLALTVPTAAKTFTGMPMGNAGLVDTSAAAFRAGLAVQAAPTTVQVLNIATTTYVDGTVPWTWGVGDKLIITGDYEGA